MKRTKVSSTRSKELSKRYQHKTLREQILHRPTMWAGSTRPMKETMWTKDQQSKRLVLREVTFVRAALTVIDEALVNAGDRVVKSNLKNLHVYFDEDQNMIQVINDGDPLHVVKHEEHGVYIPRLMFGEMNSSTNYDDSERHETGGTHGVGIKLTSILANRTQLRSIDMEHKMVSFHEWRNNMEAMTHEEIMTSSKMHRNKKTVDTHQFLPNPLKPETLTEEHPEVHETAKANYEAIKVDPYSIQAESPWKYSRLPDRGSQVCFTIWPDFERLNTPKGLRDPDYRSLIEKRVYDFAGMLSSKGVKVFLNDECLSDTIPNFPAYVGLYNPSWRLPIQRDENEDDAVPMEDGLPMVTIQDMTEAKDPDNYEVSSEQGDVDMEAGNSETQSKKPASKKENSTKKAPTKAQKLKEQLKQQQLWSMRTANNATVVLGLVDPNSSASAKRKQHVSFVNGICTDQGGIHLTAVLTQVRKLLKRKLFKKTSKDNSKNEKKKKRDQEIKGLMNAEILRSLAVFLDCRLPNPEFNTQTKHALVGCADSTKELNAKFAMPKTALDAFVRDSGLLNRVKSVCQDIDDDVDMTTINGEKKVRLRGIPKLDDANWAGTDKSHDCTLILTEGESAKALAVAGVAEIGRDSYGVYPLKGKLLNVYDVKLKKVHSNTEIMEIVKAMGLRFDYTYETEEEFRTLRYGHLMTMTDQDPDGNHIEGLCLIFIQRFWPALLKRKGFLQSFITPIVKATPKTGPKKQRIPLVFFSLPKYNEFLAKTERGKGYSCKYYKGLGTSTTAEAKEYFKRLDIHVMNFVYRDEDDDEALALAFEKSQADLRKRWLDEYAELIMDPEYTGWDYDRKDIGYKDFVDTALRGFSFADLNRSIPNVIDGLKPSQRKILFAGLKRNMRKTEVKVAQFAGYVAEHSAYHSGEKSLADAIKKMAQDYMGSNNLNLFQPEGQFGTRLIGGADAASERYVFTRLSPVTLDLFRTEDRHLLMKQYDDGAEIEPVYYIPTIPMLLVNGTGGIGTGYSSSIPCHDPMAVLQWVKKRLALSRKAAVPKHLEEFSESQRNQLPELTPHYLGFMGTFKRLTPTSYGFRGTYEFASSFGGKASDEIWVTELPPGMWTKSYREDLDAALAMKAKKKVPFKARISSKEGKTFATTMWKGFTGYRENHDTNCVMFHLEFTNKALAAARRLEALDELHDALGIEKKINVSNMVAFDHNQKIQKFDTVDDIAEEHFQTRLEAYHTRKYHMIVEMKANATLAREKARYIETVRSGALDVKALSTEELLTSLDQQNFKHYDAIFKELNELRKKPAEVEALEDKKSNENEEDVDMDNGDNDNESEDPRLKELGKAFAYLTNMKLTSMTRDNFKRLCSDAEKEESKLTSLEAKTPEDLWEEDLKGLEATIQGVVKARTKLLKEERANIQKHITKANKSKKSTKPKPTRKRKAMK